MTNGSNSTHGSASRRRLIGALVGCLAIVGAPAAAFGSEAVTPRQDFFAEGAPRTRITIADVQIEIPDALIAATIQPNPWRDDRQRDHLSFIWTPAPIAERRYTSASLSELLGRWMRATGRELPPRASILPSIWTIAPQPPQALGAMPVLRRIWALHPNTIGTSLSCDNLEGAVIRERLASGGRGYFACKIIYKTNSVTIEGPFTYTCTTSPASPPWNGVQCRTVLALSTMSGYTNIVSFDPLNIEQLADYDLRVIEFFRELQLRETE